LTVRRRHRHFIDEAPARSLCRDRVKGVTPRAVRLPPPFAIADAIQADEPWLKGLHELSWQTLFRVCTEEMDDLSQRAIKLVIEYCLEVLEEVEKTIRGKPTLARLEAALDVQCAEQFENKVSSTAGRCAIRS
jgi:hypothetical protein